MRYTVALVACIFLVPINSSAAAAQCHLCQDCEGGEHENVSWSIIGNDDDDHPCWAYTCLWMQYEGVHNFTCYWLGAAEAQRTFSSKDVITREDARALLAGYPEHIVLHPSNRFLQLLDCQGNLVVAQVEIRDNMGLRILHWARSQFVDPLMG